MSSTLRHLARAQPHEGDDEAAREEHPDGLDRGEPAAGRDTGLTNALRLGVVVAAEGLLTADAAQDAQPADDVGRHRGQLGVAGALDALPPLHGPQQGRAEQDEQRCREEHEHAHAHGGGQHDAGDDQVGSELRERTRRHLHEGTELVTVAARHGEHLAGRGTTGQDVPELQDLAGDELGRSVERDEPLTHDDGVEGDAAGRAEEGHDREEDDPLRRLRRVAGDDAGVDRPADDPGADGLRDHPDQGDEEADPEERAIGPHHPPEEPQGTAGVGLVGAAFGVGPDDGRKVSHGPSTLGRTTDSAPILFEWPREAAEGRVA